MLPYTEYLIGMILCNYITFPHIPYDSPTLRHMALQLVILGNDADVSREVLCQDAEWRSCRPTLVGNFADKSSLVSKEAFQVAKFGGVEWIWQLGTIFCRQIIGIPYVQLNGPNLFDWGRHRVVAEPYKIASGQLCFDRLGQCIVKVPISVLKNQN